MHSKWTFQDHCLIFLQDKSIYYLNNKNSYNYEYFNYRRRINNILTSVPVSFLQWQYLPFAASEEIDSNCIIIIIINQLTWCVPAHNLQTLVTNKYFLRKLHPLFVQYDWAVRYKSMIKIILSVTIIMFHQSKWCWLGLCLHACGLFLVHNRRTYNTLEIWNEIIEKMNYLSFKVQVVQSD